MTYKQKAIEACRQLAEKYRNPQGEKFFSPGSCPLCLIYYTHERCRGCPLSDGKSVNGCGEFATYKMASGAIGELQTDYCYPSEMPAFPALIARAEFFEKIIPILEKMPARRFTPSGWKFFKELDRDW